MGLRAENSETQEHSDASAYPGPIFLKLGAQGGRTIKVDDARMAAAVQEVSLSLGGEAWVALL